MNGQETPSDQTPQRGNNRTIFYVILLLLLLGINVYLYIRYNQKNTETQRLTQIVNDDSIRIADLNTKNQEALITIESYKGQNAQLDSIIAVKEKELVSLRSNYSSLQKSKKLSEAEYKRQLETVNAIVADLQNQITLLQQQNNILISKNDSLGRSLAEQISTVSQLTNTNVVLSRKAELGSLLKPAAISANGIRSKSSGKENETTSAKKVQKVKVCWDVPSNQVADPGQKTFYVRIINPEGITLAAPSSGSGILKKAETGEPLQYSTSVSLNYDGSQKPVCTYWQQSTPYTKGVYTAEIYQDGYLIGTEKFELK